MDDHVKSKSDPSQTVPPAASPLTFWALLILACVVFAPCVLVPVLQDYRALVVAESLERQTIDDAVADVNRQQRHLNALLSDPAVASRLAQRDLAYHRPGDTSIPVTVTPVTHRKAPGAALLTARLPAPVEQLMSWIPFSDRVGVYCDRTARTLLMCLSAALLIAAFMLYPPRRLRDR